MSQLIEHKFLQAIDDDLYDRILETVNNIKVQKYLNRETLEIDYTEIQKMIDIFELVIVDLWKYSFDKSDGDKKKNNFHKVCNDCYNLLQVIPIPLDPVEKMKHILKLFTYSYLGEKWEDMKRFLIETDDVWKIENTKNTDWDFKVLSNIYKSILYLIRKQTWEDLVQTRQYIEELRKDQKEYEERFLSETQDQYKKSLALELAAYYHLAGAVDLLSHYMMDGGSTRDVYSKIEYHLNEAIECCQHAQIFELDLLLRMLKTTFFKMIENSIWNITGQINAQATKFIKSVTRHTNDTKPHL